MESHRQPQSNYQLSHSNAAHERPGLNWGGWGGRDAHTKAELYDPKTGTWSLTGNLRAARYLPTAMLLENGKVLVAGGSDDGDLASTLASAELYDPATGMWSSTASLNGAPILHTATLLPGGKVLVAGGYNWPPISLRDAELYDPANGKWDFTSRLNAGRHTHTATLLPSGTVLVAGGYDWTRRSFANSSELYDLATGRWSSIANLNTGRRGHTATPLFNGKVLVVGGEADTGVLNSAELFDLGLPQSGIVASVSAASFSLTGLTSESITASFGAGLATTTVSGTTLPLPNQFAGTTVTVKDSAGVERLAPLFFVSPTQVNYQIPPGTATGIATVTITSGDGAVSTGVAIVNAVAPSLFAAKLIKQHRCEVAKGYQAEGRKVISLDWTLSHHERGPEIFEVPTACDYVAHRTARFQTLITAVISNRELIDGLEIIAQDPKELKAEAAYLKATAKENYESMAEVEQWQRVDGVALELRRRHPEGFRPLKVRLRNGEAIDTPSRDKKLASLQDASSFGNPTRGCALRACP